MDIKTTVRSEALIATLKGEIDHAVSGEIKKRLEMELKVTGLKSLVLNLKNVSFMDSSGIGMILGRYKYLKALGGRVIISGAGPSLSRIFSISGLNRIIPQTKTLEDALNLIKEAKVR